MKIEIAKSCGFCFGVKRAVQIASKHRGASTIGELIHNSQEIARLKDECGVKTLKNINELSGETAIIRTHGITKSDLATLKERGTKAILAELQQLRKLFQYCCPSANNLRNKINYVFKKSHEFFKSPMRSYH